MVPVGAVPNGSSIPPGPFRFTLHPHCLCQWRAPRRRGASRGLLTRIPTQFQSSRERAFRSPVIWSTCAPSLAAPDETEHFRRQPECHRAGTGGKHWTAKAIASLPDCHRRGRFAQGRSSQLRQRLIRNPWKVHRLALDTSVDLNSQPCLSYPPQLACSWKGQFVYPDCVSPLPFCKELWMTNSRAFKTAKVPSSTETDKTAEKSLPIDLRCMETFISTFSHLFCFCFSRNR